MKVQGKSTPYRTLITYNFKLFLEACIEPFREASKISLVLYGAAVAAGVESRRGALVSPWSQSSWGFHN